MVKRKVRIKNMKDVDTFNKLTYCATSNKLCENL